MKTALPIIWGVLSIAFMQSVACGLERFSPPDFESAHQLPQPTTPEPRESVLEVSAVKCVHAFAMCGYCNLCTGSLRPDPVTLDSGAENELCPTGAIKRSFIEDPYYEYTIDESLCIGCAKCVKGCNAFGNGSLFLQVRHDRCLNCNECSIAAACPSGAYKRVPVENPYLLKDVSHS